MARFRRWSTGRLLPLRPSSSGAWVMWLTPSILWLFRARATLRAGGLGAQVMLLRGAALNRPRHIRWIFVASSTDRIDAAREAWRVGDCAHWRFQRPPDQSNEFGPALDGESETKKAGYCAQSRLTPPAHPPKTPLTPRETGSDGMCGCSSVG
ncbi:MAG: pirin-like C-terminal cupin domain-containing protein [Paracoccaceae bacterium]